MLSRAAEDAIAKLSQEMKDHSEATKFENDSRFEQLFDQLGLQVANVREL